MNSLELERIRARRAAITPGVYQALSYSHDTIEEVCEEWSQALRNRPDATTVHCVWAAATADLFVCMTGSGPTSEANAAFIAGAPADIDALLSEIERLNFLLATPCP